MLIYGDETSRLALLCECGSCLLLDEGASYNDIKEKLDTTAPTIALWKRRYREEGLVGLATFHPGQPP